MQARWAGAAVRGRALSLDADDLAELAGLKAEAWDFRIGELALWYPGPTIAILFERATPNRTEGRA